MERPNLLVVMPAKRSTPPDPYFFDDAIRLLLGARKTTSAWEHWGTAAYLRDGRMVPGGKRWNADVDEGLPYFRTLMFQIYASDPAALFPDALWLPEGDHRLDALKSIDGAFHVGTFYACHPADPAVYLPLAGFHQYLLHEKRAEFLRLAAGLGASSVQLVDGKETKTAGEARAKFAIPTPHVPVTVKAETTMKETKEDLFEAAVTFPEMTREPSVPEDLRWLRRETALASDGEHQDRERCWYFQRPVYLRRGLQHHRKDRGDGRRTRVQRRWQISRAAAGRSGLQGGLPSPEIVVVAVAGRRVVSVLGVKGRGAIPQVDRELVSWAAPRLR